MKNMEQPKSDKPRNSRLAHSRSDTKPTPGPATPVLAIMALQKTFGNRTLFQSLALNLAAGEILAVTGTNGSGKTTLLDTITGYVIPDAGEIKISGTEISMKKPAEIASFGVRRTFQQVRLAKGLPIKDHLRIACRESYLSPFWSLLSEIFSKKRTQIIPPSSLALLEEAGIDRSATRCPSRLSFGQGKMLSLACAAASQPRILLLDEPTAGLSERLRGAVERFLIATARAGTAILIVEHNHSLITRIATKRLDLTAAKLQKT